VKLHESKTGSLLGADETESASLRQLRQGAQDTGYRLLMKGLGLTPQSQQQQPGAAMNVQEGRIGGRVRSVNLGSSSRSALIRFESAPTGAAVTLDGNLLCQKTPCTKELSLGNHRVQMLADRYHPGEERVNISGDQTVSLSLSPAFGVLKVVTEPDDLQVQINGEVGGQGSFSKELPAGRYEVIVESPCLVRTGEAVALQEGQTRTVRISPPKRMAGLDIRAEDSAGNAQRAEVFADGVKVGDAPGRFEVPLCSKEFSLKTEDGSAWNGGIKLVEDEVTEERIILKKNQNNQLALTPGVASNTVSLEQIGGELVSPQNISLSSRTQRLRQRRVWGFDETGGRAVRIYQVWQYPAAMITRQGMVNIAKSAACTVTFYVNKKGIPYDVSVTFLNDQNAKMNARDCHGAFQAALSNSLKSNFKKIKFSRHYNGEESVIYRVKVDVHCSGVSGRTQPSCRSETKFKGAN